MRPYEYFILFGTMAIVLGVLLIVVGFTMIDNSVTKTRTKIDSLKTTHGELMIRLEKAVGTKEFDGIDRIARENWIEWKREVDKLDTL